MERRTGMALQSSVAAVNIDDSDADGSKSRREATLCRRPSGDGADISQGSNSFAGPLSRAADDVLRMVDQFGAGVTDDQYEPFIEARRIRYGSTDEFVVDYEAKLNSEKTHEADRQPVVDIEQLPYLLTPQDLAGLYRTTVSAIRARAERGQIPGRVKATKKLLFHRDVIKKALDREAAGNGRNVP